MRVVVAGFGSFPGAPSNPSGQLATALARQRRPVLAGIDITSHVFATAYDAVDRDLSKLLARKPDAGTYLCNYAYWRALHGVRDGRPLVQFVHIPWVSSTPRRGTFKRGAPPLSRLVNACEQLLVTLMAVSRHLHPSPGAAHPLSGSAQPQGHSNCAVRAQRTAPMRRARLRQAAKTAPRRQP